MARRRCDGIAAALLRRCWRRRGAAGGAAALPHCCIASLQYDNIYRLLDYSTTRTVTTSSGRSSTEMEVTASGMELGLCSVISCVRDSPCATCEGGWEERCVKGCTEE